MSIGLTVTAVSWPSLALGIYTMRMTGMTLIVPSIFAATLLAILPNACEAQVRSTQDATTAYGARLTAPDVTAEVNQRRLNNRIHNRLSLRIERYRPDSVANPAAAFRSNRDDGTRTATIPASPATNDTDNDAEIRP